MYFYLSVILFHLFLSFSLCSNGSYLRCGAIFGDVLGGTASGVGFVVGPGGGSQSSAAALLPSAANIFCWYGHILRYIRVCLSFKHALLDFFFFFHSLKGQFTILSLFTNPKCSSSIVFIHVLGVWFNVFIYNYFYMQRWTPVFDRPRGSRWSVLFGFGGCHHWAHPIMHIGSGVQHLQCHVNES